MSLHINKIMLLFVKRDITHRYREQISGYQWGEGKRDIYVNQNAYNAVRSEN